MNSRDGGIVRLSSPAQNFRRVLSHTHSSSQQHSTAAVALDLPSSVALCHSAPPSLSLSLTHLVCIQRQDMVNVSRAAPTRVKKRQRKKNKGGSNLGISLPVVKKNTNEKQMETSIYLIIKQRTSLSMETPVVMYGVKMGDFLPHVSCTFDWGS